MAEQRPGPDGDGEKDGYAAWMNLLLAAQSQANTAPGFCLLVGRARIPPSVFLLVSARRHEYCGPIQALQTSDTRPVLPRYTQQPARSLIPLLPRSGGDAESTSPM